MMSVPGLKIRTTEESWPTDFERSTSQPGQPVQRLLERNGDELLHLRGRETDARGLDLDLGRGELREDVDRAPG